jgi:microcystin degradation protein MlrC
VEVEATIAARRETDFGRTIRLDSGGIRVIAAERPPMPVHPKLFREMGLSHRDADVIVQKNFFHYRLFYVTSSFRHLPVVTDGATSLTRVRERDYRVPTWPGRDPSDWRSADRILRGGFSRATANIVRA